MTIGGAVTESVGGGFTIARPRSRPFGAVFAYSLDGNSLNSLHENLKEWESQNSADTWPNYICVLNTGCIYHRQLLDTCIDSETINTDCHSLPVMYENDSLFKFYCAIHDICSRMRLGPVELDRYFSPGIKSGRFAVFGRIADVRVSFGGREAVPARLKESTLEKIVTWCAATQKISYCDLLKKQFGELPVGVSEDTARTEAIYYLYNPDNFPSIYLSQGIPSDTTSTLLNVIDATINGNHYALAMGSFSDEDWELLE